MAVDVAAGQEFSSIKRLRSSDAATVKADENEDLEDGEIEDDEEEEAPAPPPPEKKEIAKAPQPPQISAPNPNAPKFPAEAAAAGAKHDKFAHAKPNKFERRLGAAVLKLDDKKKGHLTEAEKSVMYLHKLERMEREKREKYHREPVDDFASNIEKALASILKKDRSASDDEKDDEKRGKKRKKNKDKDKKKKVRKMESPRSNDDPADEMDAMNARGGSPAAKTQHFSPHSEESPSEESDNSSDRSGEVKVEKKKEKKEKRGKNRQKRRDARASDALKDSMQLCVFFIQGKCQKGDDCPYSHEIQPPMKWELCKFYLNDCCAKGDKCLYMHSDFPCKFYHTGQACLEGDGCKFAHGRPLTEKLRQILFKHIETAPKDILGRFPRMSREEAVYKINQTQKGLEAKYGGVEKKESNIPSLFEINVPVPLELLQDDKAKEKEKTSRNRPSRWQDADPSEKSQTVPEQRKMPSTFSYGLKNFGGNQDQDMRISSNGDIDMRTLGQLKPSMQVTNASFDENRSIDLEQYKREAGFDPSKMDVDIRSIRGDTDIRNHSNVESMASRDVDIRMKDVDSRQPDLFNKKDVDIRSFPNRSQSDDEENESNLEIVTDDDAHKTDDGRPEIPANLPKRQRELFLRIQAQQKENVLENEREVSDNEDNNIDWYSDDSNDGRLTIEDVKDKDDDKAQLMSPPQHIKPMEVMEKLGDLSKIDISEEVTKLLSTIRQSNVLPAAGKEAAKPKESRQSTEDVKVTRSDPRKVRLGSVDEKPKDKISIYEQGSICAKSLDKDVDLRSLEKDLDLRPSFGSLDIRSSTSTGRSDIDLRQLSLPFKAMQNYTPATEIDASVNSHLPIPWAIHIVEIPRPDYTGLKLSIQEAQSTGDPRLRKIFRLDTEEKDSPASPKQSPKASTTTAPAVRVDPRRRKLEEAKTADGAMSYAQQMTMLQGSSFYQNLTSNQKVTLNQELATRDQIAGAPNEQILAGILNALGIVQGQSGPSNINGSVLNLLSTITNMNQLGIAQINQGHAPNMGANQNVLGPNQGINMLGQGVNPNVMGQNPNLMNQMAQSIVQPGLLGAAPGIPNLPPDFQINFDPRNGGLLGNAPPFVNFPPESANFNFSEEYFPEQGNGFNSNRIDNRPYNRDRPRRGRNFNRGRNNNFRNRNRSNRSHTPP